MRNIFLIFKREFCSYFGQPTAYAIIVVFILLSMGFNFTFGHFFRNADASLNYAFFVFHPWFFMFLGPAVGMRLWTEEYRGGTVELLGTFPISQWSVIAGKYLAAASVWLITLLLTFPLVIAVNWLGKPDNGIILSGYIASFLTCCTFLAVTMLVSAFTRDAVICLIVSMVICALMVLIGFDDFTIVVNQIAGKQVANSVEAIGVLSHFSALTSGAFRLQDFIWFATVICGSLLGTNAILTAKRA